MVDREIIFRRIELIREYLETLAPLLSLPSEEFRDTRSIYLQAERSLELIIQAMLDIGNHIISDRQLRRASRYEDVFEILGENAVITRELASRLHGLAGLRNLLVHGYLTVDRSRLQREARAGLQDFEAYVGQIVQYLRGVD